MAEAPRASRTPGLERAAESRRLCAAPTPCAMPALWWAIYRTPEGALRSPRCARHAEAFAAFHGLAWPPAEA